ncbi:MAG: hypothetical protein CM15mP21_4520 [Hyphomicrobiales bacterium]|nr:MAG: hypothetical protein CM15mP21_4520 [Hyphomicrobiales bacterium]
MLKGLAEYFARAGRSLKHPSRFKGFPGGREKSADF